MGKLFLYSSCGLLFCSLTFGDQILTCPDSKNPLALNEWRENAIQVYRSGNVAQLRDAISHCFENKIPACLDDLNYEVTQQVLPPLNRGELEKILLDNFPVKSANDLPPEFRVEQLDGSVATDSIRIPERIHEIAKSKGWKVLNYKTRSSGGFDSPPNLLIIAIPDKDRDLILQVSQQSRTGDSIDNPRPMQDENDRHKGLYTMTMITVDKTKNPPVGNLRFLYKKSTADDVYSFDRRAEDPKSCMACHSFPTRPISPVGFHHTNGAEQKMNEKDTKIVEEINQMMLTPNMSWGRYKYGDREVRFDPSPDTQSLGWAPPDSRTRKSEFLHKCIDARQPIRHYSRGPYMVSISSSKEANIDPSKIAKAMNCTNCHNGTLRGPLTTRLNSNEIIFKVSVDKSMPPGVSLTDDERMALVSCLHAEKSELASDWSASGVGLKKIACSSEQAHSKNQPTQTEKKPGLFKRFHRGTK